MAMGFLLRRILPLLCLLVVMAQMYLSGLYITRASSRNMERTHIPRSYGGLSRSTTESNDGGSPDTLSVPRLLDDVVPDPAEVVYYFAAEIVKIHGGKMGDDLASSSFQKLLRRVIPVVALEAHGLLTARRRIAVTSVNTEHYNNVSSDIVSFLTSRGTQAGIRDATSYGSTRMNFEGVVSIMQLDRYENVAAATEFVMGLLQSSDAGGIGVFTGTLRRGIGVARLAVMLNGFSVRDFTADLHKRGYRCDAVVIYEVEPPLLLLVVRNRGAAASEESFKIDVHPTAGAEDGKLGRATSPPIIAPCRFESGAIAQCDNEATATCLSRLGTDHLGALCKQTVEGRPLCLKEGESMDWCAGQTASTCVRVAPRNKFSDECRASEYYRLASQWRRWRFHGTAAVRSASSESAGCLPTLSFMPVASVTPATCLRETDISTVDHVADWTMPRNPKLYCEIVMVHSGLCGRHEDVETCIMRLGARKVQRLVNIRCGCSDWYQGLLQKEAPGVTETDMRCDEMLPRPAAPSHPIINTSNDEAKGVPPPTSMKHMGIIPASTVMGDWRNSRYIPPAERTAMLMPPGKYYKHINDTVHRLPMSIPEEVIVKRVERTKWYDVFPLKPVQFPTFVFASTQYNMGRHDEIAVRELGARSYFAFTHRRGCWTAQRHLDILACGSVPLFIDLHMCSDYDACLPGYPSKLVERAGRLAGISHVLRENRSEHFEELPLRYYAHNVYNIKPSGGMGTVIDRTKFNETAYFELADELLAYTRRHLTTKALATYFLERMGVPNAKVVMAFAYWWLPHTVGLVHGLSALGITVLSNVKNDVRQKVPYGADEYMTASTRRVFGVGYRGAGHMYGLRGERLNVLGCDESHTDVMGVDCLQWLKDGKVDVISYCVNGNLNEAMFYDDYVRDNFPPERVAFVDGLDQATSFEKEWVHVTGRGHKLFARELHWQDPAAKLEEGEVYEPPPI